MDHLIELLTKTANLLKNTEKIAPIEENLNHLINYYKNCYKTQVNLENSSQLKSTEAYYQRKLSDFEEKIKFSIMKNQDHTISYQINDEFNINQLIDEKIIQTIKKSNFEIKENSIELNIFLRHLA